MANLAGLEGEAVEVGSKQATKETSLDETIVTKTPEPKRKFSFKEKREFELLEKELMSLTKEKETITEKLNSGQWPYDELQKLSQRLIEVSSLLDTKELRWLELSEMAG